jgi:hypothetical protein
MSTSGIIDRVTIKGTLTLTARIFDEAFPSRRPGLRWPTVNNFSLFFASEKKTCPRGIRLET